MQLNWVSVPLWSAGEAFLPAHWMVDVQHNASGGLLCGPSKSATASLPPCARETHHHVGPCCRRPSASTLWATYVPPLTASPAEDDDNDDDEQEEEEEEEVPVPLYPGLVRLPKSGSNRGGAREDDSLLCRSCVCLTQLAVPRVRCGCGDGGGDDEDTALAEVEKRVRERYDVLAKTWAEEELCVCVRASLAVVMVIKEIHCGRPPTATDVTGDGGAGAAPPREQQQEEDEKVERVCVEPAADELEVLLRSHRVFLVGSWEETFIPSTSVTAPRVRIDGEPSMARSWLQLMVERTAQRYIANTTSTTSKNPPPPPPLRCSLTPLLKERGSSEASNTKCHASTHPESAATDARRPPRGVFRMALRVPHTQRCGGEPLCRRRDEGYSMLEVPASTWRAEEVWGGSLYHTGWGQRRGGGSLAWPSLLAPVLEEVDSIHLGGVAASSTSSSSLGAGSTVHISVFPLLCGGGEENQKTSMKKKRISNFLHRFSAVERAFERAIERFVQEKKNSEATTMISEDDGGSGLVRYSEWLQAQQKEQQQEDEAMPQTIGRCWSPPSTRLSPTRRSALYVLTLHHDGNRHMAVVRLLAPALGSREAVVLLAPILSLPKRCSTSERGGGTRTTTAALEEDDVVSRLAHCLWLFDLQLPQLVRWSALSIVSYPRQRDHPGAAAAPLVPPVRQYYYREHELVLTVVLERSSSTSTAFSSCTEDHEDGGGGGGGGGGGDTRLALRVVPTPCRSHDALGSLTVFRRVPLRRTTDSCAGMQEEEPDSSFYLDVCAVCTLLEEGRSAEEYIEYVVRRSQYDLQTTAGPTIFLDVHNHHTASTCKTNSAAAAAPHRIGGTGPRRGGRQQQLQTEILAAPDLLALQSAEVRERGSGAFCRNANNVGTALHTLLTSATRGSAATSSAWVGVWMSVTEEEEGGAAVTWPMKRLLLVRECGLGALFLVQLTLPTTPVTTTATNDELGAAMQREMERLVVSEFFATRCVPERGE